MASSTVEQPVCRILFLWYHHE